MIIGRLLASDIKRLNAVLNAGINYFAGQRNYYPVVPLSTMSLREKVVLFTELLPITAKAQYVLRFSLSFARILWLDSERERIARWAGEARWLFPLYSLGDAFMNESSLLEESLRCDHHDFDASTIDEDIEE